MLYDHVINVSDRVPGYSSEKNGTNKQSVQQKYKFLKNLNICILIDVMGS